MPVTDDDITKKMGALLLEGYCLLNQYCSDCQNPLMRSRDGQSFCVACQLEKDNQMVTNQTNGLDTPIAIGGDTAEASSIPNKRPKVLDGGDTFTIPSEIWRDKSVPTTLKETIKRKLSWASSRLKVDSTNALNLMNSCINLLVIMDVDLSHSSEYMITMLNLEKFIESEEQRLSESLDMNACYELCCSIEVALRVMKNLDQATPKLNRL